MFDTVLLQFCVHWFCFGLVLPTPTSCTNERDEKKNNQSKTHGFFFRKYVRDIRGPSCDVGSNVENRTRYFLVEIRLETRRSLHFPANTRSMESDLMRRCILPLLACLSIKSLTYFNAKTIRNVYALCLIVYYFSIWSMTGVFVRAKQIPVSIRAIFNARAFHNNFHYHLYWSILLDNRLIVIFIRSNELGKIVVDIFPHRKCLPQNA